jgi:hypothetical protein
VYKRQLSLITNKEEKQWEWMREFGEVIRVKENPEIPSGNWAKLARWWLYFKYEDELGIVSDMDMLPLQRDYFTELPGDYNSDKHLILKGTYDMSQSGKFPGCYMMATGKVWKDILKPDEYEDIFEWARQYYNYRLYDHKEALTTPYSIFSEESLMRAVVLQWDPYGEKTIRLTRPGGWFHGIKSTSLRVDRSQWPQKKGWELMGFTPDKKYPNNLARPDHPPPNEGYYIDAHLPRPLEAVKKHLYPLLDYLDISYNIIDRGIELSKRMRG